MSGLQRVLAVVALAGVAAALALAATTPATASMTFTPGLLAFAVAVIASTLALASGRLRGAFGDGLVGVLAHGGAAGLIRHLPPEGVAAGGGFWALMLAAWALAWLFVDRLSFRKPASAALGRIYGLAVPLVFGVWLLILWELVVRGFHVPSVLLPPPSMIFVRLASATAILWADFQQTFLKAVVIGYALGCGSAFAVAIMVDRSPFLRRGLLPIGNLVSALPIIGVAPIMVMWFGFDWPSKAAVVIIMTFFPMLVNTVAGLAAAGHMERDLMKTYAASYWQTLVKLRLPAALPFIFTALKINSTLALIGAIVAEFFGTPIVGMGFRISTEVGRMNVDMVWAEIAVAALAGSAFYGAIALLERASTFWHPSFRG